PEEEPQLALSKAEAAVRLAEKELAWARANRPALEARLAADRAKYASPADPKAEALAQAARKVEREAQLLKAEAGLLRGQQKLADALSGPAPTGEKAEKAREKRIGAARQQLRAAEQGLGQATESYTPLGKLYPKTSSGRRLALARWIASRQNPLTARVAVNHLWLRHFGQGLVTTPADFGLRGKPPTHPELLDWLACELMENNWSMKAMHRLMVTSRTYRQQSAVANPKQLNLSIDGENRYLWRMNLRRMEAEAVRDSILQVAGQLDTTLGGPELDENEGEDSSRRSLYFRSSTDSRVQFLKVFDSADPNECYERNESIIPQQALALANSRLSYRQARLTARKLSEQVGAQAGEHRFISAAFETVLGRPPSAKEREKSEGFLVQQTALFRDPERTKVIQGGASDAVPPASDPQLRARESLVHVLFNHTDFVTIR
ncbi:MAG: DUF1553 domain-containing protein, partial [Acidobacteria bacterium]|nr:DUF1553 domain-containing protein [Acidobacteriota bacterium]